MVAFQLPVLGLTISGHFPIRFALAAAEAGLATELLLHGAWLRVFLLIGGATFNQLQTSPFVEEHIAISDLELR